MSFSFFMLLNLLLLIFIFLTLFIYKYCLKNFDIFFFHYFFITPWEVYKGKDFYPLFRKESTFDIYHSFSFSWKYHFLKIYIKVLQYLSNKLYIINK